jgi:hypothetical protein
MPDPQESAMPAQSTGPRVPRAAQGRVHSVFRRACNIELDSGELLTLLDLEFGNLPCGIRCAPPGGSFHTRLRQGQAATIVDGVLRVPEAALRVDCSRAPVWHCRPFKVDIRSPATRHALLQLRAVLCLRMPAGGFAPLLFSPTAERTRLQRSIAARLRAVVPALADGVRQRRADEVMAALSSIIGLGVGLTPSGDDFIVGYLAALWSRAWREPALGALLCKLDSPLALLAQRTGVVSRQQLLDAVRGRFAQRLGEALHAIARNEDVAGCAQRAMACGHSSGADTLCGLLSGLWPAHANPFPSLRRSRPLFVAGSPEPAMAA